MEWGGKWRLLVTRGVALGLFVLGLVMASGAGHQWG